MVKILFKFYSNILDEWTVETMWAKTIDISRGLYQINNIPFYAPLIASDDIVLAEYDEDEQMLTYRNVVKYSGNSTIHIVVIDKSKEINDIRDVFINLGCISERANDHYFSMEIPAETDYNIIKQKLSELADLEIIDYAESCLSEKHKH